MITNAQTTTRVDEIGDRIYRISTPVPTVPGGFSFNRYLVVDDAPLLFHTGPRGMGPLTREAIAAVVPVARLRFVAFSHWENDESGALNELLAVAPEAVPVCSRVNAMVNGDACDRAPRALADGETLSLGSRSVRWIDAPHVPHAWECGYLFEPASRTFFCGDLFTQPGLGETPLTEGDILGPSEKLRGSLDYYAHARDTRAQLERLAKELPATTLACMHGSAWRGDGAALLRALAERVTA
ncbi:MAG: MBL fold metallo-hydrolase [Candidatus Rokubacteria bacterium]|nr:MBL fold metallo-hydrolase [Candidatus Rokubacteria bacterium]